MTKIVLKAKKSHTFRLIKIPSFIARQAAEVRSGGIPTFARKLFGVPALALAVPVLMLMRALRPFVLFRIGVLWSERLGHLALNTEIYLCERDAEKRSSRTVDLFYYGPSISNQQLKKMWDRTLPTSPFFGYLDWLNRRIPGGTAHQTSLGSERDIHGLLEHTRPHIAFTRNEELKGIKGLKRMGISEADTFVCLLSRDSAYLQHVVPGRSWNYHEFRDSNIANFIVAANELAAKGHFVVRAGAAVNSALGPTNPRIIDYATRFSSPFMDIYLGAKCHFYLGDSCGFHAMTMVFRRPAAIVNMVPLGHVPAWGSNFLFIPKKLKWQNRGELLSFREMLSPDLAHLQSAQLYVDRGIEVLENTPEEIAALALEMDARLRGTWQSSEEDEELQQRFWSHFEADQLNGVFRARISAQFLRHNRDLLE